MSLDDLHFKGGYNFLGYPDMTPYEEAKAVIIPVPYDGTTSYRSGTREGPMAIIIASRNVETYDIELECEPLNNGVHTLSELEPDMRGPEETVNAVENVVNEVLKSGKLPVMLGGEHSLTFGAVKAAARKFSPEFSVLQLDAHADLRDSYESTPFSHASVMRRVINIAPITQVGIRNVSAGEIDFIKASRHDNIFWDHEISCDETSWISDVIDTLKENVYVTIDLDAFDPAIMPAVGTPEPGGMTWRQAVKLFAALTEKRNIIGFDVMELCPVPGNIASDFFAAKLTFKLLGRIFSKNGWIK